MQTDKILLTTMSTAKKEQLDQKLIYRLIQPFRSIWMYVTVALLFSVCINHFIFQDSFNTLRLFVIGTLWSFTHWVVQSMGNGYVSDLVDRRFSWLDRPWTRTIVGFICLVLFSAPAYFLVQLTYIYLYSGHLPSPLLDYILIASRQIILISSSVAFVFTTIGFLKNWRSSTVEAERLRAEMMTYKYDSLRNQVNPHFLFNSLNTLSDLVYEDQDLAVKFIRQLSDIYRYVLDSREREAVPLREEMEFIDSFSMLLKTRFEDKLLFDIDVPLESNDLIVPMALQNLIENAVKHNEASTKHPLMVHISREGDFLVVRNEVRLKKLNESPSQTGLRNIRARYEFLTDEPISVLEKDGQFVVRLPILKETET